MQGNWENWRNSFWWSANREFFLRENDFKGRSEIQKFSRENVEIFWWSANRDKICKVVRESEKVENRCTIVSIILKSPRQRKLSSANRNRQVTSEQVQRSKVESSRQILVRRKIFFRQSYNHYPKPSRLESETVDHI